MIEDEWGIFLELASTMSLSESISIGLDVRLFFDENTTFSSLSESLRTTDWCWRLFGVLSDASLSDSLETSNCKVFCDFLDLGDEVVFVLMKDFLAFRDEGELSIVNGSQTTLLFCEERDGVGSDETFFLACRGDMVSVTAAARSRTASGCPARAGDDGGNGVNAS